jgi:hypothetical protein
MEFKLKAGLLKHLILILSTVSLVTSFKVKLGTDGIMEQESGMMDITMENQMEHFMDREHIIGE